MRILVATDAFKGTLAAEQAAAAIAEGWLRDRPQHDVIMKPLSDGGPGFVRAMAVAHGVPVRVTTARHSLGGEVQAEWCMDGATAYLESAQVVGLDRGLDVMTARSIGLGDLLYQAWEAGARRLVIGLGGTNVCDGGAGMLARLHAKAYDAMGGEVPLHQGPAPLVRVARVELLPALKYFEDGELLVATDVDVPLLGPRGAALGFAAQKGASEEQQRALEAALTAFSAACGRRQDGKDASLMLGAGAAGGLGFGLLRLGARRVPGIDFVWEESGIDLAGVDLVITGEGSLDWQSLRGKVISGVARRAQARGIPVIAIAGRVLITPRERGDMGLDATYSVSEMYGAERSLGEPAAALANAAQRLVRTWG